MNATSSPPRLRLGNYEPLLELAAGGMATVYVARQVGAAGFERLVVVKRVHRHHLGNREFYDMFKDEARVASLVRHPNVVSVIDVVTLDHNSSSRVMESGFGSEFPRGADQGELFLVMEYVESSALSMLLKSARDLRERIPPAIAARIIADTLAGLHAAHEAKDMQGESLDVVHRDVSPQNIIVGIDGSSRLIDFGVAKAANRLTETKSGSLKGKIAYMSPEQTMGQSIDRRVDVFAAGVALHEALTGRRLFRGENDFDTMRRIAEAPIPDPSVVAREVPKALDAVVQRALQREPANRFQSAQEFLLALEAAIPPAPPRDVAALVMRLCGTRIQERRDKLSAILGGKVLPLGTQVSADADTMHSPSDVAPARKVTAASIVEVGDVINGKFRVESILGEGGMGIVVSATHLQLEEEVALKFLKREALQDPESVARFSQEARAAAKLKSEHVARVLDVSEREDGTPFIVMEKLRGQDLRDVIDGRGPMPITEAADYVIQACEALAEAHARGIVHRDIKPENLFLVDRSEGWRLVKVLDFGISKAALTGNALGPELKTGPGSIKTSSIMGSPHYMSPEQLRSTANVDHRADIWSIGAVLYELISGHTAFEGSGSLADLIATILEHPAPGLRELRPEVPQGLEAIVARCLERDRKNRYSNAAELAIALLPFAPRRSRLAAERAVAVTREAGLSDPFLRLPPSIVPPSPLGEAPPSSSDTTAKHPAMTDAQRRAVTDPAPAETNKRGPLLLIALGVLALGVAAFAIVSALHKDNVTTSTDHSVPSSQTSTLAAPTKPLDSATTPTTIAEPPIPASATAPAPASAAPTLATSIASAQHPARPGSTAKGRPPNPPATNTRSNPDLEIRTTR